MQPSEYSLVDYGLAAVALLVVYRVVVLLGAVILKKAGVQDDHAPKLYMPCQMDPSYGQRQQAVYDMVQRIRDSQEKTDARISSGQFDCPWQGRDEIHDLKDTLKEVVRELKALTVELRMTRNGGKS